MSADFCDAEHKNAKDGCYGSPNHTGKHWSYANVVHDRTGQRENHNGNFIWEWDDTPAPTEAPAGSAALVLNDAELGILLTTLEPVKQFFPDLQTKLIEARRRLQK